MLMVRKEFFVCQHCEQEYESYTKAELCEKNCKSIGRCLGDKHKFNSYHVIHHGVSKFTIHAECACGLERESVLADFGVGEVRESGFWRKMNEDFYGKFYELISNFINCRD